MNDVIDNVQLRNKGTEVEKAALEARRKQAERDAGAPEAAGMARAQIKDDHYKDIPPRFEETTEPLPATCGSMASAIATAYGSQGLGASEISDIGKLHSDIGNTQSDWHGNAAETFDEYYLKPFDTCVENQILVLNSLERAMLTYEKALEKRRADVIQIGDQTIEALESLGSSSGEASLAFTILGLTLTVVGTAVSGGSLAIPLAAAGASAIGATASAAGNISGATADSIVKQMYDLLDDLDKDVNLKATEIAERLGEGEEAAREQLDLDKSGKKPSLLPREPDGTESAITSGDPGKPDEGDNPHEGDFEPPEEDSDDDDEEEEEDE